jgi:alpha-amylase
LPSQSSVRRQALTAAVAVGGLAAALTHAGPAAAGPSAYPGRVSLMGTLQSEAGCTADWSETCTATDLRAVAGTRTFALTTPLPAGSYEYKVRLNGSWDESYGAEGGGNLPLVLLAPATVRVVYDADTHAVSLGPVDVAGATDPGDRALAQESLREDLTRERFYFVMADRFENGDPTNDLGGHARRAATTPPPRAGTTAVTCAASSTGSTTSRAWARRPSG